VVEEVAEIDFHHRDAEGTEGAQEFKLGHYLRFHTAHSKFTD